MHCEQSIISLRRTQNDLIDQVTRKGGVFQSRTNYDVGSVIKVYVGLNNLNLARKDRHPELLYKLLWVK